MTDKEAIKYLQQLYPNGGHCWLDEQRIEAIGMAVKALQEEPVSEDLDIFASEYVRDPDNWVDWIGPHGETDDISYIIKAIKAGAQWQFNQLEKNRLVACDRATKEEIEREQDFCDKIIIGEHRQPTYSDAIEYGIDWQKKQMMKEAIEREVKEDAGGYPYIPQMELYDYDKDVPLAKEGDKYKVVLIKEE